MTLRVAERRMLIRLGVGAGLIFAAAVVMGWRAGETPVPPPPPAAKEQYSLATRKPDDLDRDLAFLKFRRPWRALGQKVEPKLMRSNNTHPAETRWRLAGIVQRGDKSFVLIATGQPRHADYEYRTVGDSLPDGSILVQITLDSAKTRPTTPPDAKTREYRLFNKKP